MTVGVWILIVVNVVRVDQVDVVTHDLELGHPGIVISLFSGMIERIAHDSNEHVQEHDLDQERACEEEQVDQESIAFSRTIAIGHELAQAQLILAHEGIKHPESTDVGQDLILISLVIHVQDVEGRAKHHVPDHEDHHEVSDAPGCLHD